MQWKIDRERLERQRRETTRQSLILNRHQKKYRLIKEANAICKGMGKNIRFRPCLVKQAYDGAGRHMSITDAGDDELKQLQFKEELQVQVDDKDRKTMTMWSAEDFEDKLDMMRTAFAQFQEQQLSATGKQLLAQVDKDIFGATKTSDFAADLAASF